MLNPRAGAPLARSAAFWPVFVVFAVGCLAYLGAAGIFFVKDDLAMATLTDAEGNPSFDAFIRNFLWPTGITHDQFYRPLPVLFAWFDLSTFGVDPAAFRICNIGFHALNAVLLGIFLNQLTQFRRPAAGWFAGLLFALHPVHGEAVLWVTQRMVVQCATFSLLALIALEAFFRSGKKTALGVCIVSAVAAALCKEVTVALPATMVVIAATRPAASREERVRRTLKTLAAGAALSLAILVLRRIVFGVWVGTYGMLTAEEYARVFRIFERLPQSLIDGFWAVNPLEAPGPARTALGFAWLAFLAFALFRLVLALRHPEIRRSAAIFLVFAAASFLPTLGIFYVEATLTNGRFLYQPMVGVIGLLLTGFATEVRRRPIVPLAAPAALALLFALAQQLNLRAWHGADLQIRTIRDHLAQEARRVAGSPLVIAYGVPMEHHGVVTLDLSVALAMRPPFTKPPGLDVFPFVGGQERAWPDRIPALRAWLAERPGRPVLHLACGQDPPRVSPLIGALEGPRGATPLTILSPGDGALILHPAESPTFAFLPVAGAATYRLRLEIQDKIFVIDLDPAKNLKRVATRYDYGFERGCKRARVIDAAKNEVDLPDPATIWGEVRFQPPQPVTWTLEALDANGRTLGRSAERSMVLLTTKVP